MNRSSRNANSRRYLQQILFENLETRRLFDGGALPMGAQETDIGAVGPAGSTDYVSQTGTFTIQGGGSDVGGSADAFHYVYASLTGNGEITARINSVVAGGAGGMGGLDLRSTLDPTAENTFAGLRDDGALVVNTRNDDGSDGFNLSVNDSSPPVFLRLIRNGDEVLALSSPDGITWTQLANSTLNNLPDTVFVGEAVTALDPTAMTLATADIDTVSIAQTSPPTASVTASPDITAAQSSPYQFSVTYSDDTSITAASVGDGNLVVFGPDDYSQNATLVSSGLTDSASIEADYTIPAPTENGSYTIDANPDQVMDDQGTPLAAGLLGSFNVAIPDTQAPTATLTTAPTITTPLSTPYQFTVTYTDDIAVSAATLGDGNLTVTGPGGYSQNATLVSTGLVDGPTIVATYSVPAPTVAGTYTVLANAAQVTDSSANALASGAIGTFMDAPAVSSIAGSVVSALNSAPIVGRRVFLDANGNGVLDIGETAAITDSNGAFSFTGLAAGTYRVTDNIPAGGLFGPPNPVPDVIPLSAGQAATGIDFSEVPAAQAGGPDLTVALVGKLPSTVVTGSKGSVKVKVTNNGSVFTGPVTVALQASADGSPEPGNIALAMASTATVTLKPGASRTLTLNFTYPDSLPAGSMFLLAVADPANAIAESNEANNTANKLITTVAASRDLTGAFAKLPAALVHGKKGSVTVTVSNLGTTPVAGPFSIRLFESADQTLDGSDVILGTLTTPKSTSILEGKSKNYRISFTTPPAVVFGNRFILAQVDSANVVAESNENNNTAATTTTTSFT